MRMRAAVLIGLLTLSSHLGAQAPSPSFEVASIKPNKSSERRGWNIHADLGRLMATNMTVQQLIGWAYTRNPNEIELKGFEWGSADRFDITAKAEGNAGRPELVLMAQSLLRDRFGLRMHTETRDAPILALVVARSDGKLGPKMVALAPKSEEALAREERCHEVIDPINPADFCLPPLRLSNFASIISYRDDIGGRKVIDRTNLAGTYSMELHYAPDRPNSPGTPFTTALQEQLGLKLQPSRGPVEVLVIDHIERPTPD